MVTETQRTHAKQFPISKNNQYSVSSLPWKLTSVIYLLILSLKKGRIIGNTSLFWENIKQKSSQCVLNIGPLLLIFSTNLLSPFKAWMRGLDNNLDSIISKLQKIKDSVVLMQRERSSPILERTSFESLRRNKRKCALRNRWMIIATYIRGEIAKKRYVFTQLPTYPYHIMVQSKNIAIKET